jgi:hypothetical protein
VFLQNGLIVSTMREIPEDCVVKEIFSFTEDGKFSVA